MIAVLPKNLFFIMENIDNEEFKTPPIPVLPCWYCGRLTNAFSFIKGNACSYEHLYPGELQKDYLIEIRSEK